MTERELLYVKTVAEEGSMSKAARKLFLSQPSLSKCIQGIESTLGTKLFKRTNTGLLLTFAGERYYKVATEILKIYNDFEIEVSDINNLKKGRLIIGTTRYLATLLLPIALPVFKQKCPNIEIVLIEENSTELEKTLLSGKLDFAIIHTAPSREFFRSGNLNFIPLLKDPFMLTTRKGHPLNQYAKKMDGCSYPWIDFSLFAEEPFILVSRGQKIREVSELIFQKANMEPNTTLTTKSYETARRLACEGIGVTFVPLQYSQIFVGAYQPSYYFIDDKYLPYWTLGIAVKKDAYVSKAAKLFIRIIGKQFDIEL